MEHEHLLLLLPGLLLENRPQFAAEEFALKIYALEKIQGFLSECYFCFFGAGTEKSSVFVDAR